MRTIYLLRHCETQPFFKKRCIGITDIDLSENGLKDAYKLKEYLSDKNISHVFCSPAVRAVKTAEVISDEKIHLTILPNLHEINMGDWDGLFFDEIKSKFPEDYRRRGLDFAGFSPPNGESFSQCRERAQNALCSVINSTEGNVAVVAHAGFNRALLCGLCSMDLQELFKIPQPFGCVNILSVQNGICTVQKAGLRTEEIGVME